MDQLIVFSGQFIASSSNDKKIASGGLKVDEKSFGYLSSEYEYKIEGGLFYHGL